MTLHTIAVTGANGSVGRRVVLFLLGRGYHVIGIDSTPTSSGIPLEPDEEHQYTSVQIDLRSYEDTLRCLRIRVKGSQSDSDELNQSLKVDGMIHLAGIRNPGDYGVETHNTNVVISYNVLRACAELGIDRIAQASSINVYPMVYSNDEADSMRIDYFPIDENHHTDIDEPYGLSKVICELQAESLCRRYPSRRIASLRLHWSIPNIQAAGESTLNAPERAKKDLWGWVQEDECARAFWLALTVGDDDIKKGWKGHEAFVIAAPTTRRREGDTRELLQRYFAYVKIKEGFVLDGRKGFFDCGKAERVLGWVHDEDIGREY